MQKPSFTSKLWPRCVLLLFLVLTCFTYSCRKDLGLRGKDESASALADHGIDLGMLQRNYNNSTRNPVKTAAITEQTLASIIGTLNVDWTTYTLYKNADSSQTVEFDMPDDNNLPIPAGIRGADSARYHAVTKAVFIVKADSVRFSFFMKAIEDQTAAGYQPTLNNLHYKRVPITFTGNVLYFTMGRQFLNGYTWQNGSISKVLSLSGMPVKQQQVQALPVKPNLVACTTTYWEAWHTNRLSDGTLIWVEYLYTFPITTCGPDDGSGGGDGGGGATGDAPDAPKCVPTAPPVLNAVKGRVIINVVEGGGGGGDTGGGGTTVPCPTVPGPSHPIFGINNSNAVVPDSNFDALLGYLEGLGLTIMDPYDSRVTINGVSYTGQITEVLDANGNVAAAYFSPDANGGTMQLGFEYSIGNKGPDGTGTTSSNVSLPLGTGSNFPGSPVTYTPPAYGGGGGGGAPNLYPFYLNVDGVSPITINDVSVDPSVLDYSTATITSFGSGKSYVAFNNAAGDYPDNHPVSIEVRNFNKYIFDAFRNSNNTSIKYLHATAKGTAGPDGYGKAIGAIGEGLVYNQFMITPSISVSRILVGAKVINNTNPTQKLYIDMLLEHKFSEVEYGYSYLILNHTDRFGSALQTRLKLGRNSLTSIQGFSVSHTALVAYEIKTYNPANDASVLLSGFKEGVEQTIQRAMYKNMSAGVLIFDQDAFANLLNSVNRPKLEALLDKMASIKRLNGDRAVFLFLEKNLWSESNKAYYAIRDRIKIYD